MPDSYQPPISEGPHDPFEKFRIEAIEKERQLEEAPHKEIIVTSKPQSALTAYISLLFNKLIDVFEATTPLGLTESSEDDILKHFIAFKKIIDAQKEKDLSQDWPLLNQFAYVWHQLLDDLSRFRKKSPFWSQMNRFLQEIQHAPPNRDHSLGYYLTEYAGQKWLPFPYLEIIQTLHVEYQKNKENSHLERWSESLKAMIHQLSPIGPQEEGVSKV